MGRRSCPRRLRRLLSAAARRVYVSDWCTTVWCTTILMAIGILPSRSSLASVGGVLPSRCEQRLDDLYDTRGRTTIDKLGDRYLLTVRCEGVHQIHVRVPPALNLAPFVGKSVRVRYWYVDEDNPRTSCVRTPCPPAIEHVLDITGLEEVTGANVPSK